MVFLPPGFFEPNTILCRFKPHRMAEPRRAMLLRHDGPTRFSVEGRARPTPRLAQGSVEGGMAKLYFHYATMDAGKTTMLLQAAYNYRERGMTTMLFVAGHYRKDDSAASSPRASGWRRRRRCSATATICSRASQDHQKHTQRALRLRRRGAVPGGRAGLAAGRVADRLSIPVMCYGLRTDFQGNLFSGSRALLAIADELREVRTICRCGRKATMVVQARAGRQGGQARRQVAIGKDAYVSLCRRHWEEEMGRGGRRILSGLPEGGRLDHHEIIGRQHRLNRVYECRELDGAAGARCRCCHSKAAPVA